MPTNPGYPSLHDSQYIDNPSLLDEALKQGGLDLEAQDDMGMTALGKHCLNAYLNSPRTTARVLSRLIDAGANPNGRDESGTSPLHYLAVSFTYEPTDDLPDQPVLEDAVWDLFDLLISRGANPDDTDVLSGSEIAPAIRAYVEAWALGGKSPRTAKHANSFDPKRP